MRRQYSAACCAVLLALSAAACSTMEQQARPEQKNDQTQGLTAGDIARMSPAEVEAYYRKQEQKHRTAQSKSLLDSFNESKYSTQKRKKLRDVSHPIYLESNESIFPWRSGRRSEQLHDSLDLSNR